jgi:hypothetical protein
MAESLKNNNAECIKQVTDCLNHNREYAMYNAAENAVAMCVSTPAPTTPANSNVTSGNLKQICDRLWGIYYEANNYYMIHPSRVDRAHRYTVKDIDGMLSNFFSTRIKDLPRFNYSLNEYNMDSRVCMSYELYVRCGQLTKDRAQFSNGDSTSIFNLATRMRATIQGFPQLGDEAGCRNTWDRIGEKAEGVAYSRVNSSFHLSDADEAINCICNFPN